ncbi:TIGR03943 family protein [Clostridium sp. BNL1100]|uniref:TIGR03943 family putative permease subunit n=1 Tax=Clostridium sp. BNL1100 TaxID=755731 RepID=UPI00024A788C|nr:TIGR03943 family protein [Clostridium sp. BNL1100]AEY67876.1 TIGR03943 family protein [Clostridium sp. BNL1100]
MKKINGEVLVQIIILFLVATLLTHAVITDKIKYYVNIHIVKYIWVSVVGVIIIALSLVPGLFKPKRRNNMLPCIILAIPLLAGTITPAAPVDSSGIKANTGQIQHERDRNLPETQLKNDTDIVNISDDEYLKWYTDACENPDKYDNKTVRVKGTVFRMDGFSRNEFIPARMSMVCCAADLVPYGFICKYRDAEKWKNGEWVYVTAKIKIEYEPHMKKEMPILYGISVTPAQKPENELVYPY